jgi:archaemetzincin
VKPLARPPRVLLVAIGGVPRPLVHDAGAELGRVYGVGAAAQPAQDRPKYAFNETRGQYHSAAILRRLAQLGHGEAPVLGITDVDLFDPDQAFVFGDADRDANAALVSTARLFHGPDGKDVDAERLRRRLLVESVHEVGHLLGLSHCPDARCAMYLSHRPSDADRKGPGLCHACRSALGLGDAPPFPTAP